MVQNTFLLHIRTVRVIMKYNLRDPSVYYLIGQRKINAKLPTLRERAELCNDEDNDLVSVSHG